MVYVLGSTTAVYPSPAAAWAIDGPADAAAGYEAFRSSATYTPRPGLNDRGLSGLNLSGSSQMRPSGLPKLLAVLAPLPSPLGHGRRDTVPDASIASELASGRRPVFVIDARQESHLLLCGADRAMAWREGHNQGNAGRSPAEVLEDERQRLYQLLARPSGSTLVVHQVADPGHLLTLSLDGVCTEAQLVQAAGAHPLRMPMSDEVPTPPVSLLDALVACWRFLPDDAWVHIHCEHGHGRTTVQMVLYDCWRNASQVSLADIIVRQHLLGGVDLTTHAHAACLPRLHSFYAYAVAVLAAVPGTPELYSLWRHRHAALADGDEVRPAAAPAPAAQTRAGRPRAGAAPRTSELTRTPSTVWGYPTGPCR